MDDNSHDDSVERELVIPGQQVGTSDLRAGHGVYADGGMLYAAQLGVKNVRANYVNVIPLAGKYMPRQRDMVVGRVVDLGPTIWFVDIAAPYPATLHVNEVAWNVSFGETGKYLNVGDTVLAAIASADETMRIQLTMKESNYRKLNGGRVVEVAPSKVPRLIGRSGSMINLLKGETGCRIFVGQNGRVWVDGGVEEMGLAVEAIRIIERDTQMSGVTDAVREFFNDRMGGGSYNPVTGLKG